ncbi:hypothetical protein WA026_005751 [Henosepilachna vigintioctopunctata]|uniref:Uncharacterized protein n=1 Tax=Henosepilachna vigintioctopunctata TaxID=420089 RepID=A0AAW1U6D7_9CUCU
MIKIFFFLIFYVFCFGKINGDRYENFESLEKFSTISTDHVIEKIQQDDLIFPVVMADFRNRLFPFIRSFMGANRMRIRDHVNTTLATIENIVQADNATSEVLECVESNKKILLYLYITSLSDWSCLKRRALHLVEIAVDVWGTIFEFSLITDDHCLIPVLCSGLTLARLTGSMAVHAAKFIGLGTNFFPGMRKCQRNLKKLQTYTDIVIDKIRLCVAKAD